MPDFSRRSQEEELMDDLQVKGDVVNQTLEELEIINKYLGGNAITLSGVNDLLKGKDDLVYLSVIDLGCGRGDMLELLDRWAKKKNIKTRLTGFDANPNIIKIAREHHRDNPDIFFEVKNIFDPEIASAKADIIIATLFTHHFTNDQLTFLLKQWSSQVSLGIVINDLHRHWVAYHSIKWITRYFSKSEMVQHDGPVSVHRAFRKREWKDILRNAGITKYKINWKWAFRWKLVIYSK